MLLLGAFLEVAALDLGLYGVGDYGAGLVFGLFGVGGPHCDYEEVRVGWSCGNEKGDGDRVWEKGQERKETSTRLRISNS